MAVAAGINNQPEDQQAVAGPAEGTVPFAALPAVDWPAQLALIANLAQIVQDERLSELEIESNGVRITVRSPSALPFSMAVGPQAAGSPLYYAVGPHATDALTAVPGAAATVGEVSPTAREADLVPIVSPMVGVFYRASSPDNPPLVEINDYVEVGHVVGIIEAMKVFNEITSEIEGTVVEIRAQNAELVETGAPLVLIRPA